MNKIKYAFFAYIALCVALLAAILISFGFTRQRDPQTHYGTYGGGIKSLDPASVANAGDADLIGYVFECLYNYAYGEDKYRLIPELADGDPVVSADGKVMTIRIKPGVHFYDPEKKVFADGVGPEVTAADFVYSWKRVCNFQMGYTSNYGQVFQGHVAGIDDWFSYTQSCTSPKEIDWDRPVAGLQATDRYTLRIELTEPFPQLQYNLAMMSTAVICRQVVEYWESRGEELKNHLVGTGPYAMSQHLPDQQIVFTANPIYRGGPDVKSDAKLAADQKLPHIQRIQLNCFQESLPPWYLFLAGQLDGSGIPKDTFGQAIAINTGNLTPAMEKDGIRLEKYKNPEIQYIGFNMKDPLVGKNKPLRQAMSLAYDRQRYIELYRNGRGLMPNGPIPPGFPTYDAKRVAEYCQYNLDLARQKMKEAEAINGGKIPPIHILYGDTDTTTTQNAEFTRICMEQIGLTVLSDFKTYNEFLNMIDRSQEQIFLLGWVADYPDEQDFWQLFYTGNIGPGGLNSCNYSNPEFDKLYDQTKSMADSSERTQLYEKMQDMVLDDCPWIFGYYPTTYVLYHNWQSKPWLSDYGHGFKAYSTIDFQARAEWLSKH